MRYIPNPHYKPEFKWGSFSTSKIEIRQLWWAWLAISVAFANVLNVGGYINFPRFFLISGIAVGLGFLFHEMGHKILAQKFGLAAEFRASYQMLIFAVIISFFGFVFAAPGAVMILGRPSKKQNGIISAFGPLTNFFLAMVFLLLSFTGMFSTFMAQLTFIGYTINVWLGLFNLIPVSIFDGRKIWHWNKAAYLALVVFGISLFILQYI
ncbi:hypothetical protein KY335_01390 [Candidatus Woesearchaeota archaeon]|nr:hypothetical protein [Candidatus Woesearchaeota archaeon]